MMIQVGEASPPHRETAVAEFHVRHDGYVGVPAELYRDGERLMIALYSRDGGSPWEFPVADFLRAIGEGMEILRS